MSLQPANDGRPPIGGRFVLGEQLGAGKSGSVYEATDLQSGRPVALKHLRQLTPRSVLRFKSSFRALANLPSTRLVRLLQLVEHDGDWYLAMERVEGAQLQGVLDRARAQGDHETLRRVLVEIAEGLDELHRHGFVHRDLKPANVLATDDGSVRLLDFELVDLVPESRPVYAGTELAGTPRYMAPEQILREPARPASDYYALGVLAFHALTGQHAHAGTIREVFAARCDPAGEVPRCSELRADVPPELDELVARLLERDPARRAGRADVLALLDVRADGRYLAVTNFHEASVDIFAID